MPSTVVRMKPEGLFGPGETKRAMMPAIKPITMTHRKPMVTLFILTSSPRVRGGCGTNARETLPRASTNLLALPILSPERRCRCAIGRAVHQSKRAIS
jgi:hypothetical protein